MKIFRIFPEFEGFFFQTQINVLSLTVQIYKNIDKFKMFRVFLNTFFSISTPAFIDNYVQMWWNSLQMLDNQKE